MPKKTKPKKKPSAITKKARGKSKPKNRSKSKKLPKYIKPAISLRICSKTVKPRYIQRPTYYSNMDDDFLQNSPNLQFYNLY